MRRRNLPERRHCEGGALAVEWRKSSYSAYNGACVDVASWRKSSHSGGGNCVEAASWRTSAHCKNHDCIEAGDGPGVVGVRDTALERQQPGSSPVLEFSTSAWTAFIAALKAR